MSDLKDFLTQADFRRYFEDHHLRYIEPVGSVESQGDDPTGGMLCALGIERLYSHQRQAIELIDFGRNVVVMTPTGSGKSLCYNLPVLKALKEGQSRALYVFPLKGLGQDQLKSLTAMSDALGIMNAAAVYDGDTSAYRRKKIRDNPPGVILTNPDMLHYGINAYHQKWEAFFRSLKYVVIDEIHAYRGVFGSNVSHVIRRLRRICLRWGVSPVFIACSATIANAGRFARDLTGLEFEVIDKSGAPRGGINFMFGRPAESPYTSATRLFVDCLRKGLRTIVFTKSQKITELIYSWSLNAAPELASLISPYRAGFLPSERREIEEALFSGRLRGVVSTSALELGVDIGGLDVCILVGYPGSVASTWQRAGRVGRRGEDSLVVMVAQHDALDQYYVRHPEEFFGKSHEAAVIDPMNPKLLKAHLSCAAREVYLRGDDAVYDVPAIYGQISEAEAEGFLRKGRDGDIWFSAQKMPHSMVNIRSIGRAFSIYDHSGLIGQLDGFRVLRDAFPGAIYLHRARQYEVTELDIEGARVLVRETDVKYYTQALTHEDTKILRQQSASSYGGFSVGEGVLTIRHQVVGYQRKGLFDREAISSHELELPEYIFESEGIWFVLGQEVVEKLLYAGFDLAGTLHAFEHAAISAMPVFALCDKGDIGGISYELYPHLKSSAIFIYDGFEGGVGLSRHMFGILAPWLRATLEFIEACPCPDGCPSCVQDPQCGSGNDPLDKPGAAFLCETLLKYLPPQ